MVKPQQTAFLADIAAPAAVQSTTARWLAAVCSTAALPAPKARRRHAIVIFSGLDAALRATVRSAATWTLQLCGRANHPQARMTPMGRIAPPRHQSGRLALTRQQGQAPTDETRQAPSLIHQRRARGRKSVDQLACSCTSLCPSTKVLERARDSGTATDTPIGFISNCFESADRSDKACASPLITRATHWH